MEAAMGGGVTHEPYLSEVRCPWGSSMPAITQLRHDWLCLVVPVSRKAREKGEGVTFMSLVATAGWRLGKGR